LKTILILEDNHERIAAFQRAVASLGSDFELKVWRDTLSMCAECEAFFPNAALISLDHDLNPMPGVTTDPGTGLVAAEWLGDLRHLLRPFVSEAIATRTRPSSEASLR
jgi:hypothetical protein